MYDAMVKYRDSVFPYYISLSREIVDDDSVRKIQNYHFDCFYNTYLAIKNNHNCEDLINDSINNTNSYIRSLIKNND